MHFDDLSRDTTWSEYLGEKWSVKSIQKNVGCQRAVAICNAIINAGVSTFDICWRRRWHYSAMHFIFGCTANCIQFPIIIIFFRSTWMRFEFRHFVRSSFRVYSKFNFLKTSRNRSVGNKTKLIAFAMGNGILRWRWQCRRCGLYFINLWWCNAVRFRSLPSWQN